MSGVNLPNGTKVRKGAAEAIEQYVKAMGGKVPADLHEQVNKVSSLGGTPLTVCENDRILGVIYLKDADYIVKQIGVLMENTINEAVKENRYDNMSVRAEAREKIARYVLHETGKRPMILPAIIEINTKD